MFAKTFVRIKMIASVMGCCLALTAPAVAEVLHTTDGTAPIIFTAMTHTDGTTYTANSRSFLSAVEQARWAMSLYDEYGLKMNLEASKDFATANTTWSVNILAETVANRHGVGTHANGIGGSQARESTLSYARKITENKRAVDALVGTANNVSISGICGRSDWVAAAARARFKTIDAITGMCYLSMPEEARPDGWTDDAILSTYYHDAAPVDFAERISPFRLKDSQDFTPDADGVITISNGELGELASLAEGRVSCGTSCELGEDDFQVVYDAIDLIVATRDPGQVARINIHIPMRHFDAANESLLRSFMAALKAYADDGAIAFGTQKDVVDTYEQWR
ncbi:MAG: hypothetical protein HYV63_06885 [Candidatus Schekmanbacteria bacterium]|nr:hypothetical protein [Candidatus Schekmanbacteria bacterium]